MSGLESSSRDAYVATGCERVLVWRSRGGDSKKLKDHLLYSIYLLLKLHIFFATRRYRYDALHRGHGVRDRARAAAHDTAEKNI